MAEITLGRKSPRLWASFDAESMHLAILRMHSLVRGECAGTRELRFPVLSDHPSSRTGSPVNGLPTTHMR